MSQFFTYARLGPSSLARVGFYRLGCRSGLHPALRLSAEVASAPFFRPPQQRPGLPRPNQSWDESLWRFGWHRQPHDGRPPNWFANPFSDAPQLDASRDWWRIPDFGSGDIKGLWELSRFDWVVAWATTAAHGNEAALARLDNWLQDWSRNNPPYKGPNWKCGQEASIRVMHLVLAAWILGQDRAPESGLVYLLKTHLQRIAPTISYAIGQQNNHGTSEAAALFIGGSLLEGHDPRADSWARTGRRWLEERAQSLIESDGSFSQYSVTYHRVMLDTYSLVEAWRRHRGLASFSGRTHQRLSAGSRWLRAMTDIITGDSPNIGANDGARLIPLTDADYRDFRPSVQLASALFCGECPYPDGPWNDALRWLGVNTNASAGPAPGLSFDDGGYHVLRAGEAMAVMRYPRFRFRPGQADALHLDLWRGGENLLRDAGTFSYNAEGAEWFGGTAAHNTVEFDGRDQMPRLGRFLFGNWLKAEGVEAVATSGDMMTAATAYTDSEGARHHRRITLCADGLNCTDTISGDFKRACLRWRLAPGEWALEGQTLAGQTEEARTSRGDRMTIEIASESAPLSVALGSAQESRYYLQRSDIPVLTVSTAQPCTIVTRIAF